MDSGAHGRGRGEVKRETVARSSRWLSAACGQERSGSSPFCFMHHKRALGLIEDSTYAQGSRAALPLLRSSAQALKSSSLKSSTARTMMMATTKGVWALRTPSHVPAKRSLAPLAPGQVSPRISWGEGTIANRQGATLQSVRRPSSPTYNKRGISENWRVMCPNPSSSAEIATRSRPVVNVGRNLNRIRRLKSGHSQRVDSEPKTSFPLPLRR